MPAVVAVIMGLCKCLPVWAAAESDGMQGNGEVYEALSTMAACFLRADSTAICDCIKAFGLNDLLWDLTQSVGGFRDGKRFREPPPITATV